MRDERGNPLARQIVLGQERPHRPGYSPPPVGRSHENDVVRLDVLDPVLQRRLVARRQFLLRLIRGRTVRLGIRRHRLKFHNIPADRRMNGFGDGARVAGTGIVDDQRLGSALRGGIGRRNMRQQTASEPGKQPGGRIFQQTSSGRIDFQCLAHNNPLLSVSSFQLCIPSIRINNPMNQIYCLRTSVSRYDSTHFLPDPLFPPLCKSLWLPPRTLGRTSEEST